MTNYSWAEGDFKKAFASPLVNSGGQPIWANCRLLTDVLPAQKEAEFNEQLPPANSLICLVKYNAEVEVSSCSHPSGKNSGLESAGLVIN